MDKIGRVTVRTRIDLHEEKAMPRKGKRANLKGLLPGDRDSCAPGLPHLPLLPWLLGRKRRPHLHLQFPA